MIAALFGTAAGTTLLIGLKTGAPVGKPTPVSAAPVQPTSPPPGAPPAGSAPSAPAAPPAASRTPGAPAPTLSASRAAAPAPRPTTSPKPPTGATGTFTGSVAQTPYGPVQVRIVMSGGRMTDVTAVQLPNS
ncbi:hypothetical protein HC031_29385 [Planosporangium thailandense]|uniref:Serine/threonine protein kinase n=1 Tax=Planosporangium thailandense TaxID=765197 RepID=A0ABX0Y6R6_9ACTN|nr:hypothetical protein [Planosporangium thailandense]NJC73796.1 hypothetical protein [Planosporangium thailandense]